MKIPFLSANWQDLVVFNYSVDPEILKPYLPRGVELDLFEGQAYLSLIAFQFSKTKFLGLIPVWPQHFEEINLRFYVKHTVGQEVRRGVCFIKEVIPSQFLSLMARALYNEPYIAMEAGHTKENFKNGNTRTSYYWQDGTQSYYVEADSGGISQNLIPGSFEEFILEHYWGYTAMPDASTSEYQVAHQRWLYQCCSNYRVSPGVREFYGKNFEDILSTNPHSVFYTPGSAVSVSFARRFKPEVPKENPQGWVLYDGHCGFCSKWVPFWQKQLKNAGFEIAPLQAEWIKDRIKMHPQVFDADIRLMLSDNTLLRGADVYVYVLKKFKITWLLGFVMGLPFVRQFVWLLYRYVNLNRFFISKVCGLNGQLQSGSGEISAPDSKKKTP